MSNVCTCGGRLGATGIDNCIIQFFATHNFILWPIYKNDGTKNFIDLSSPTWREDFQALTSIETDPLERIYPLPYVENVTREKTERITETAPSGNIYNVQDGLRQNHQEFWGENASFRFMKELERFGCEEMGYLSVDINGTLEGWVSDDDPTKFYPFPMMSNTFYTMYMYATDTAIAKLTLDFNLERNFQENQIYYLTKADLGFNATALKGLIPGVVTVSDITTTGITAKVGRANGSAVTFKPITGLVLANFTLYDNTGSASVTITGVTESSTTPGEYALTYSAVAGINDFTLSTQAMGYDIADVDYVDPS